MKWDGSLKRENSSYEKVYVRMDDEVDTRTTLR